VIAPSKIGAEMEVAVEVDMSSTVTLRKAVLELLKKTGSNSTVESQSSENAENSKRRDPNLRESRHPKLSEFELALKNVL
jgi:hypothetical protein